MIDPLCRCGVYWPFQKERNTPVECNSDESHTPGEDKVGSEGVESEECLQAPSASR